MYRIFCITSIFLISVSTTALASQPDSANGEQGHSMSHAPKAMLAVGATLDENGRLWIARVENQRLLVSWSDDEGKNFSTPVAVTPEPETIAADGESRPKIAVTRDGTVLLTWVQSLPQKYAGNVRFARSTDSGKSFSSPITLNDDGRITAHRFDSMAIDGNGRVVIAWLDARDRDAAKEKGENFTGTSIYTTESANNGKSFDPNRRFYEHACECCRIALAWTKDGPAALWRNIFGTNTRDFAIANLDKGGVRRATRDEWKIDACPHNGGSLAADRWGKLHLAWFTNGTARQGLFYKNIDGDWESSPMPIGNPAAQANHASVIAEDKIVILSWREFDGQSYSIHMMYSVNGGVSWSEPARLMSSVGATDYPIPLISGEQVLVLWNTAKEGLQIVPIERITAGHSS
ncbi:MAG: sialidase family protein [Nitrosospira sp.]